MTVFLKSYRSLCLVDSGPLSQKLVSYRGPALSLEGVSKEGMKKLNRITGNCVGNFDRAFCGKLLDWSSVGDVDFVRKASEAGVSHLSLVLPGFSERKAANLLARISGIHRVSCFIPQRVSGISTSPRGELIDAVHHIVSQFLPSKFRDISSDHLSLAMRLNSELCDPGVSKTGNPALEMLMYADCMQVIGRDDRI